MVYEEEKAMENALAVMHEVRTTVKPSIMYINLVSYVNNKTLYHSGFCFVVYKEEKAMEDVLTVMHEVSTTIKLHIIFPAI